LHARNPRASGNRRARLTRALQSPLSAGAQVHLVKEVIMSATPTLETLHAAMQAQVEDVLRMCADIEANLEAQQALLGRMRRVLEARGVAFPAE
jgi:hypothetical protein